ncbi:hypothetical protein D3P07_09765 [Paenibacillus sp. 1011MAR3C5]|uniref:hypothetical protein n=1 Tax=Paenibacillus sp. 1011MAR3C5 TaxID=1675787 RepID=UPI000E6C6C73|nr:hypothetical protein [Paenibacillus sp. 1011MAR3C5]RJE88295.1 hypothetical protein D3P07_09765 [Paenibacillus sp. 1011MAR3C5]
MEPSWITTLLLVFGIAVGIVGVIAYLRLLRKEKLAATVQSSTDSSPSDVHSGDQQPKSEGESTKGT